MDRNRPPPCPPEPPPLFYNHFRDKYEAMAYVLRRGVDAQAALIGGFAGHDRRELAALLCRYVKGHRALIVNMISYNQQNSIHEFMVEYGSLSLENEIKEKTGLKTIPDDVRHSIDIWTRGALGYGMDQRWLQRRPRGCGANDLRQHSIAAPPLSRVRPIIRNLAAADGF